ncbi:Glycosyltransferase involved in cell wall bisynthesis [Cyclobacterium lianum]|uniref:Glycosyltransferase involved in cell wall bisynthesis n=1 Tax=Cyclobacterium lianum TaxID=388280 RepID=A0A1M7NHY7_9BACT|nr:glycosyltransferase [Cyclobacterium lianum]SHN02834.1 Glycosyltransferase involved in cell wall bisynthesis [Cyclobacterium lianum]
MNNRKPRLLLVNNYSMENAYALWEKGNSGSHHVWGKIELENRGKVEVRIFPHEKYPVLNKIGKLFGIKHLDQQVRILAHGRDYDILYAPYSLSNTRFLIFLKLLGLYRKPILVTVHQPFLGTNSQSKFIRWLTKKVLLQYDGILFLSEKLKENTVKALKIEDPKSLSKIDTAQWGPDTNFYRYFNAKAQNNGRYFISAGHTARDYGTLIEAFKKLNYPLKIFCTPNSMPQIADIPENVTIYAEFIPYVELMQYYVESMAILIPLKYPERSEGCQGMTSLQDVVALGKPTVITKNPSLNLDAAAEGFGITVEKGDVSGWVAAVESLVKNKAAFQEMEKNAIRVYQEKFNSDLFAKKLEEAVIKICHSYNIDV